MDTSSSEELTSDEEIDEIIELAWEKTKKCLSEPHIESDHEEISLADQVRQTEIDREDDLPKSPCFVLDKSSNTHKPTITVNEESGESDVDDNSSLFVVDKQPSINLPTSVEENNGEGKETKKSRRKDKKSQKRMDKINRSIELSSSLKVNWDPSNIYVSLHSKYAPQPKCATPIERLSKDAKEILKKSVVTHDFEKKEAVPSNDESRRQRQKERKQEREKTKGKGWYNLPKGEITEEVKNDLIALKMRRALDPKRFYKGDDIKGMPKYFQFGTVVEDASEFYSARIPKKQRKKSMVDELMADAEFRKFNKRKYAEIEDMKSKGLGPYQGVRTMKTKKKKKKR